MHYEVITEKTNYFYNNYNKALRFYDFLTKSGIECTIKAVYKARAIRN